MNLTILNKTKNTHITQTHTQQQNMNTIKEQYKTKLHKKHKQQKLKLERLHNSTPIHTTLNAKIKQRKSHRQDATNKTNEQTKIKLRNTNNNKTNQHKTSNKTKNGKQHNKQHIKQTTKNILNKT